MREQPDLIVLDLTLPDLDGAEVFQRLRTVSAAPIVILSARAEERERQAGLALGAVDYVTKPFEMEDLLARMRTAAHIGA